MEENVIHLYSELINHRDNPLNSNLRLKKIKLKTKKKFYCHFCLERYDRESRNYLRELHFPQCKGKRYKI